MTKITFFVGAIIISQLIGQYVLPLFIKDSFAWFAFSFLIGFFFTGLAILLAKKFDGENK